MKKSNTVNLVKLSIQVPHALRLLVRRHAGEHDLPMQGEIVRVLERSYGVVMMDDGNYLEVDHDNG